MAKDSNKTTPTPRAQKTTAADLRKIAAKLRTAADQIDAQAERMKQEKIESVMIEGRQGVEGERGVFWQLRKLLASCHRHIPPF